MNWRAAAGALTLSLLLTGTARAQTPPSCPPDAPTVSASLLAGGTRLGPPLQHADGGWWVLPTDTSDAGCLLGTGSVTRSCPNLFGVNGLGLLDAYRHTLDQSLLLLAKAAGDGLVSKYETETPHVRPPATDIEFLGALWQTTGDARYRATAIAWFGVILDDFPLAAARVDALFESRASNGLRTLAVWDAASVVRAARAVGNTAYATGIANRVVEREGDIVENFVTLPGWKNLDPDYRPADNYYGYDYTLLGEGSMLTSIYDLPDFVAKRDEYRADLLLQQDVAGGWDGGDVQITSYVVKGLVALGDSANDAAIGNAACLLITHQFANGGWPWSIPAIPGYPPEYTEVDSEVMQALSAVFNTPEGANVPSQPSPLASLQFSVVTGVGTTTATSIDAAAAGPLPGGFDPPALAYEIATTASFSGSITVCFWVPAVTDAAAFDRLRIMHNEGGTLVDRTILAPGAPAPNFAANTLCARVASLSPFAVAARTVKPPRIIAPKKVVEEATGPSGAVVTLTVFAVDKIDGPVPVTCAPASGSVFPLGDTPVICSAANAAGKTDTAVITVRVRDTVDPVIDSVAPSWPTLRATGAMVPITLTVIAHDLVDPSPACAVTRVTSNVKDVDHDGVADWSITGPLSVSLEAATKKHRDRGYRITVTCTDASGNASSDKTTVVVSHLP